MICMSTKRRVGRPSKGDRSSACTRLPQPVRANVDVLVSAHGLLGEVVAALAEAGLQHVEEAAFEPVPPGSGVATWTRLPRPVRTRVDELVVRSRRSIADVLAALVAVGLRHLDDAPLPKRTAQEALMT